MQTVFFDSGIGAYGNLISFATSLRRPDHLRFEFSKAEEIDKTSSGLLLASRSEVWVRGE